jgi:hypothetical protein
MLPLVVALTLAATPLPPSAIPIIPRVTLTPRERPCGPDIDPSFVHYVAPPRRSSTNSMLWWISDTASATTSAADKAAKVEVWGLSPKSGGCLRPLQAAY